jgi:hypothetical protein
MHWFHVRLFTFYLFIVFKSPGATQNSIRVAQLSSFCERLFILVCSESCALLIKIKLTHITCSTLWIDTDHWRHARSYRQWHRCRSSRSKMGKWSSRFQTANCVKLKQSSRQLPKPDTSIGLCMNSSGHWVTGMYISDCTLAHLPVQSVVISDVFCILGYLLITFSQVFLLGTELSLSSRGRMTLGVGEIFWFISHTLPQCHTL